MPDHAANFRAANEFLQVSAVDGGRLARSTRLLDGYLSQWMGTAGSEAVASVTPGLIIPQKAGTSA